MEVLISGYTVLLDDEDAHLLVGRAWLVVKAPTSKPYVRWTTSKNGKRMGFSLHRMVMNAPKGIFVDHRNGNTLDCRKGNLRFARPVENSRNMMKWKKNSTSRFKGVHQATGDRYWTAQISYDGKRHRIGRYLNEFHAAYAYDMASIQHHGEFGWTNFLPLVR